ncbi:hypothetical protein HKX48_002040, partial [Thoreauomyces humboldtii]
MAAWNTDSGSSSENVAVATTKHLGLSLGNLEDAPQQTTRLPGKRLQFIGSATQRSVGNLMSIPPAKKRMDSAQSVPALNVDVQIKIHPAEDAESENRPDYQTIPLIERVKSSNSIRNVTFGEPAPAANTPVIAPTLIGASRPAPPVRTVSTANFKMAAAALSDIGSSVLMVGPAAKKPRTVSRTGSALSTTSNSDIFRTTVNLQVSVTRPGAGQVITSNRSRRESSMSTGRSSGETSPETAGTQENPFDTPIRLDAHSLQLPAIKNNVIAARARCSFSSSGMVDTDSVVEEADQDPELEQNRSIPTDERRNPNGETQNADADTTSTNKSLGKLQVTASINSRARTNSMKWAGDGGVAKKMGKPIWKPGGMDEVARAEFMERKAKGRALTTQVGKGKRRAREKADPEGDEGDDEGEMVLQPEERPPLQPHEGLQYQRDNLKAVRFSSPRESPPAEEVADNNSHTLRTEFLQDFTRLASHFTTQQDIEMQAILRDVDAIGTPRSGWSGPAADLLAADPSDVRVMCKTLYAYLKSEKLIRRGGLLGESLGREIVGAIGDGDLSEEDFAHRVRKQLRGLDRHRYLYAKAMLGHIVR